MSYRNNFLKQYNKNGYFIVQKFLNKKFCKQAFNEILKSKGSIKYYDTLGNPRRIEKIYNKGKKLKILNDKILIFLFNELKLKFTIFKDKFNLKPPNGEGFYAHYDGVFMFNKKDKKNLKGWYEYADEFLNVLVAFDKCNSKNGTIELAKSDDIPFIKLIKNTNQNGTPIIKTSYEKKLSFKKINLDIGDMVVFKNTCPHRSGKNYSNSSRSILYYTYNEKKKGNFYKKYFLDKKNSTNKTKKSLSGSIV
jgi:hypothetical protein